MSISCKRNVKNKRITNESEKSNVTRIATTTTILID